MKKAREIVQHFTKGMGTLSEAMPETIPALGAFFNTALKEGVLTCREKELVAIGWLCTQDALNVSPFTA